MCSRRAPWLWALVSTSPSVETGLVHPAPTLSDGAQDLEVEVVGARARVCGAGIYSARHRGTGVTAIAMGRHRDLHNQDLADWLLKAYSADPAHFADPLNGSFVGMVIDPDRHDMLVVTDHLASRRVFHRRVQSGSVVSTTLSMMPTGDLRLDTAGIAFYLANGSFFLGRTPFAGLTSLPRASVCAVEPGGVTSHQYWRFHPRAEPVCDRAALEEHVERLLVRSVADGLTGGCPPAVSASGGVDTACIIGILANRLKVGHLDLVTYYHGEQTATSDSQVARSIAQRIDCSHIMLEAYEGCGVSHIERNAHWGEGCTPYCTEIDAWWRLADLWAASPTRALYVGDQSFIYWSRPLVGEDDLLVDCVIADFQALSWSACVFGKQLYRLLAEACAGQIAMLRSQLQGFETLMDAGDYLYMDQRLVSTHMPWRERFIRRVADVQAPLVDRDLYDLVAALPLDLRAGRSLFCTVMARFWPNGLPPRAAVNGSVPDWHALLRQEAASIRSWMPTVPSRLDELVPPAVLDGLLLRIEQRDRPKTDTEPWCDRVERRLRSDWARLRGKSDFHTQLVYPQDLLLRLLTLRTALRTDARHL